MSSVVHRPVAGRVAALGAALALVVPLLVPSSALAGANCSLVGLGDAADPFEVDSAADLELVGVGDCGLDAHYLQTSNIVLPAPTTVGDSNYVPISDRQNGLGTFTGTFDGGGFSISGLVFDGSGKGGLIADADGATVRGVHLVDVDITSTGSYAYTGGLIGEGDDVTIIDSSVSGVVRGLEIVGGLLGYGTGSILNSFSSAVVVGTASSTEGIGGLVGEFDGTISGSYATGDISGEASVGGLAGLFGGTIEDSFASGDVAASGGDFGGLVGVARDDVQILRSFATGTVYDSDPSEQSNRVGGLVGDVGEDVLISQSFATGDVTARRRVGGLVGSAGAGTEIIDSYASGDVTGSNDQVGGLVGRFDENGVIRNSYAVGLVTGVGASDIGGLVGQDRSGSSNVPDDFVVASFWDLDTSQKPTSAGGPGAVGRSTSAMKTLANFADADWAIVAGPSGDSGDVWGICARANSGYPFLLWQAAEAETDPCGASSTGTSAGPSYVAPGGVLPLVSPGLGEWVQADGSSVPLAVSSPGPNQVRYSGDGIQVTFTGGAGSDASRGLVANPAGEVVCEICVQLAAGGVIEAWMFSTPRLVAAWRIEDLPCQTFAIPVASPLDGGGPVGAGAHTLQLALPTSSGMQAVNVGVTVGGPVPARVPAGEGPVLPAGLLFAGVAAAAFGLRRLAVGTAA